MRHYLIGYDREFERIAFRELIPSQHLSRVKELAKVREATDPWAIGSYPLSLTDAETIAEDLLIVLPADAHTMDFFLEPMSDPVGEVVTLNL